jgi:hypothetical protein
MCDLVLTLTKSFALDDDLQTAQMATKYRNDYEYKRNLLWASIRKGSVLNSSKVPMSALGVPFDIVLRYDSGN